MDKTTAIELILEGFSDASICMASQHMETPWSMYKISKLRKECAKCTEL